MRFLDLFHYFFENDAAGKSKPVKESVQKPVPQPVNYESEEAGEMVEEFDEQEFEEFFD